MMWIPLSWTPTLRFDFSSILMILSFPREAVGVPFDMDDADSRRGSGCCDAHGLAESVAADFHHAEAVHLANAGSGGVNKKQILLDHFADFRFGEVVALDFGIEGTAHVRGSDHRLILVARDVG